MMTHPVRPERSRRARPAAIAAFDSSTGSELRPNGSSLRAFAGEILAGYGQVFFARSRSGAALAVAATFTAPRVGTAGLIATFIAAVIVRLLHLNEAQAARGHYGYNALLTGLALGAFVEPGGVALALLVFAAASTVLLQAALESALGSSFNLPALTLPFVIAVLIALVCAPHLSGLKLAGAAPAIASVLPPFITLYLKSIGAMFFVPTEIGGALVLAALLAWSRIGALLSFVGYAASQAVLAIVAPDSLQSALPVIIGYNGAATAIALGGVWFVPQRSSFALGALAVPLAAALTLAANAVLAPLQLPVLILPFNLTAFVVLQAMRQRTRDGAPKSVDFAPGTPEANLNYYRTRLARFGARLGVRFRLPFWGRWTVTQGVDGKHTHKGEWRHALDFEVLGEDGENHEGTGTALKDYHCYRLPVFAAAAGTVVKIQNDVPDNLPGQRNPRDPWGNVVLVQHGPALYSLVAHLAPGSVEVAVGQYVTAGTRIGLCGNSGRSFVPHLHFQLQTRPELGAPTCELEFADVVAQSGSQSGTQSGTQSELHRAHVPVEGEAVRNVDVRDEIAALFAIPLGGKWIFEETDGRGGTRRETITACIDLYNNVYLESAEGGGRLYFERQPHQFIVYDHLGPRDSVLHLIHAALPRVPFEAGEGLAWDDVLSRRAFRTGLTGPLLDFVDPFLADGGQRLRYASRREAGALVVTGRGRRGRTVIETSARIVGGTGIFEVSLRAGGAVRRARLIDIQLEVARESVRDRGAAALVAPGDGAAAAVS